MATFTSISETGLSEERRVLGARILPALAACGLFLVYAALPSRNFYWDGVTFAHDIESARSLVTLLWPNHLLYDVIGWCAYTALGGRIRALYVLQFLNAGFAALAAYLLWGIIARATRSWRAAAAFTALFAFAGIWWRFSTDANAYILSVCLLLACARLLEPQRLPRPWLLAALYTLAMLVHQLAVLFLPAAIFALWWQGLPEEPLARRMLRVGKYAGSAATATLLCYVAAFRFKVAHGVTVSFWSWTASHTEGSGFFFRPATVIAASARSWMQVFGAGRPELWYWRPLAVTLVTLTLISLALAIRAVVRSWPTLRTIRIRNHMLGRFAGIWFATYAVFLLFWMPRNSFYKLFAWPALVLLLAACWMPRPLPFWRSPLIMLALTLALFNLTFAIVPYSRTTSNVALGFSLRLEPALASGALVYYHELDPDDSMARYFNPQTEWRPLETVEEIDHELASGKPVWLDTTALDYLSQQDAGWLNQRSAGQAAREVVTRFTRMRFVQLSAASRSAGNFSRVSRSGNPAAATRHTGFSQ